MKRRVRTQPTNPFYSNEPAVATSQIADKPPVQNASLGNAPNKFVDRKPGKITGVGGFESKHKPPAHKADIKLTGPNTPAKVPSQGSKLRVSGHSGAHQIGIKKLKS